MSALSCQLQLQRDKFLLSINTEFSSSGITAITGPSGSGKTTLLRCIAGLEQPQTGSIHMRDQCWYSSELQKNIPTHQRPIAYVFQDGALFSHLNVQQNLVYGYQRLKPKDRLIQWDNVINSLSLLPLLKRNISGLSGGERQRVSIARALLTSPSILLLDEPVSALDNEAKLSVLDMIQRIQADFALPILYVSHALDELARIADSLLYLREGKLIAHDNLATMLTHPELPFRMRNDAFVIAQTQLTDYDDQYYLATLRLSAGTKLQIPMPKQAIGMPVNIQVHARDISLTMEKPNSSSILNILPAKITRLDEIQYSPGHLLVTLMSDNNIFYARITQKSAQLLKLEPGKDVYMQIKSIAITR